MRAFTLIETLVAVSIIGVLVSILAPAISVARAIAQEKICATSLRSWGAAFHLYAGEYDGTLPHTDDRARNRPPDVYDPAHPEHECCYIDALPPLMGGRRAWRDFASGQKPRGDIWQCPGPQAEPLPDSSYSPRFQPSVAGYHTYAMNSYLECDFPFGLPAGRGPYPSFLKLNRCDAAGETILMFEQTLDPNRGYGQQGGHSMAGRYTAEDARALCERHAHGADELGGNFIFVDGHHEWLSQLWDESLPNPRMPAKDDLTWFPY
ncbi:MAG: type II secretion system protein [Planctomycetota bacterium]|jgi:prepilin-type N-terminal cleavage/methylation domain-containing protein